MSNPPEERENVSDEAVTASPIVIIDDNNEDQIEISFPPSPEGGWIPAPNDWVEPSPEARLVLPQGPLEELEVPADHYSISFPAMSNALVTALETINARRANAHLAEQIQQNIDVLLGMGFSCDLIARCITTLDTYTDIGLLVNQCLYFDNLGQVPRELLQDVDLDSATFIGSRVTSQRHHMTYKVMEFDKENACVFIVPIIYDRFQWGRGTNRAFWVPMNSHDIHFDYVRHNVPNDMLTDENCKWYELPHYTISTAFMDSSIRGKDWATIRPFMHTATSRSGIFHDLIQMEKATGPYSSISHPVYPQYHTNESYRRYKESIIQHMVCICDVHNLSVDELQRIIDEQDRQGAQAMGHGIPELFEQQKSYRSHYNQKHDDWKKRCIPLIKLNVEFDWAHDTATIAISVCDKSKHSFMLNIPQRFAFADVIGRSLAPKLFKTEQHYNNGGQSGRILTTSASKITSKTRIKEKPKISAACLDKLQPQQRKVFDFLVDRATSRMKYGWSSYLKDNKQILFHTSGMLRFLNYSEDIEPVIASNIPCGAIAVLPPKSGKSTMAAMFAMEMATRMRKLVGRTHKALIVINKCQKGFIEIIKKVVDATKFKVVRWRSSVNHVEDLSYRNITHMSYTGCIVVVTSAQVKSDTRIRHINWDSIAFDDAHMYSSCASAAAMLHGINLLRKPVCIFTQNKTWKVKEFNFYMHMINMFHINMFDINI